MEINRCYVRFLCASCNGCKHAKPYPPEYTVVSDDLKKGCIHYFDGNCTNKPAQEEAKSE